MNPNFYTYPDTFNKQMPIIEPTYDQHIIKTPEKNITYGRIPKRIIIDSKFRDHNLYKFASNYSVPLDRDISNIISIELVQACIPYTGYIINNNNNKLYFEESWGSPLVITIPEGNYSPSSLAIEIQNLMNNIGDSNYTIIEDLKLNKFIISSNLTGGDHIFRLLFKECPCISSFNDICESCPKCPQCSNTRDFKYINNSIGPIIGFDKINKGYASGTVTSDINDNIIFGFNTCFEKEFIIGDFITFEQDSDTIYEIISIQSNTELTINPPLTTNLDVSKINLGTHIADFIYDVNDVKYIVMDVNQISTDGSWGKNISNDKTIDDSFSIIPFTVPHGENNIYNTGTSPRKSEIKYFNPPLSKLDKLHIKFLKPNGELYDFNGRDHMLDFEIISLNSPGKYNTF